MHYDTPLEAAQSNLEALRSFDPALHEGEEMPSRGFRWDLDPDKSDIDAQYGTAADILARAAFQVRTPGRWLSLSVALGRVGLGDFGVFGFACEAVAPHSVDCRVSVRTGREGGFHDVFFDRHLVCFNTPGLHVDAVSIADQPALQGEARWRNLMFHFESRSFDITMNDLRIFVA